MPVFPNFFPFSPRLRRSLVKIPEFSQSADISAHLRQKFIPVLYCTSLNSTLRIEQKAQALRAHLLISGQPPLMPRILSISYDKALLHTRELMLSREGFEVVSAVGFSAAVEACKQGLFDLVIMGHSIPSADKAAITTQLRAMCDTPILALRRPNEEPLKSAEYNFDSGDPQSFLTYVKEITNHKTRSTK